MWPVNRSPIGASLCGFSPPPGSYWPLPSKPQLRGSPNSKRFVFCDICYLLLAHCFGGGGVMLKFLGAVEHALFDTITHFSHGECHQCHFPHFFFFFLVYWSCPSSCCHSGGKWQTSQPQRKWGRRWLTSSPLLCLNVSVLMSAPLAAEAAAPFSRLGLPFGALWWEASCLC